MYELGVFIKRPAKLYVRCLRLLHTYRGVVFGGEVAEWGR